MNFKEGIQLGFKVIAYAAIWGVVFTFVGAVLGFVGGLIIGMVSESITGISAGNAPLIFILTAPIGGICGIIFGAWKALKGRAL